MFGVKDGVGFFSLGKSGSGNAWEVCWGGLATSLGSWLVLASTLGPAAWLFVKHINLLSFTGHCCISSPTPSFGGAS